MKLDKFTFGDRWSIKWKVLFYLIIFIVVILVFLWLCQVVFLNDFYKFIKINDIKSSAEIIENNINDEDLPILISRISDNKSISITVMDAEGQVLISSYNMMENMLQGMPAATFLFYYDQAQAHNGSYLEKFSRDNNQAAMELEHFVGPGKILDKRMMESILYTEIVTQSNGEQRVIMLNSLISPVDATVDTLRVQLLYVAILMLALAVFLAFVIARKIAKPIIKINESAKDLASGDYETTFSGQGYLEIAELNKTLNYAAKELSKVENLRRELIANISHDLRTPLTMITGYAEVMRDLPNETTAENIQIIIDEAKRLTTLVNDVFDISKLQTATQDMNITRFSLTQSILDILQRYGKLTEQEGYQIEFEYEEEVFVAADELRMSQVIYNLINNALTYTGDDKQVIVSQIVHNNAVRIEVRDNGQGIPADKLEYIWDRYYKLENVHKRAVVGTGLGLSIVKNILQLHAAKFGVSSQEGQGSIFWFELPLSS